MTGMVAILSSLFSMKIEKRTLGFIALLLPLKSKFTSIHSTWSVVSLVVYYPGQFLEIKFEFILFIKANSLLCLA